MQQKLVSGENNKEQNINQIKKSLREEIGNTLLEIGASNPDIVVLDAEVGNSTFSQKFKSEFPDRFIQNYIAEQNMVSTALGLSIRGKIPVSVTFAAFFMRSADQIRMSQYSFPRSNLKFIGTHVGVSIGEDGPSQMALEDISFFRCIFNSVVLYPSDSVSTSKLLKLMVDNRESVSYLRVTRGDLPEIYNNTHDFVIGGSKTLISSKNDLITLISAGITLHECLKVARHFKDKLGINIRVVDVYSIKPLDLDNLNRIYDETQAVIVVEDHYKEGGLYEAICASGELKKSTFSLSVTKLPKSGTPAELLNYMEIDFDAIVKKCTKIISLIEKNEENKVDLDQ
jgi:transketolase